MRKYSAIVVGLVATFWMGTTHACSPPEIGDQLKYKNGQFVEIVKVNSNTCNIKLCVRPVGSKQDCRWINDPRLDVDGPEWITKQ